MDNIQAYLDKVKEDRLALLVERVGGGPDYTCALKYTKAQRAYNYQMSRAIEDSSLAPTFYGD